MNQNVIRRCVVVGLITAGALPCAAQVDVTQLSWLNPDGTTDDASMADIGEVVSLMWKTAGAPPNNTG